MAKKVTSIFELERNDVEGALALMDYLEKRGEMDDAIGEALLMLQDDPKKLHDALEARAGEQ